ncbi:MAG TPA: DUF1707 domain-containing protein [Acidimicrobiales bacterium]|nr:DUF1707 domain-containing protein [Acidimicrobiales bacterium]
MTDYLRVSDDERRRAGDLLARHFVDGRLDRDELDERSNRALHATTRRDLDQLFADLPPLGMTPAPVPGPRRHATAPPPATARRPSARRFVATAVALLLIPLMLFVALATVRSSAHVRFRVERVVHGAPAPPLPPKASTAPAP